MKINTLAGLSGVSSETIRKYRDRDLLRPYCNPENGYYDYSNADFLNLLYIRKLRGANLSLDTIGATYSCDGAGALLDGYRETLEELERQIAALKRREMMLRLTSGIMSGTLRIPGRSARSNPSGQNTIAILRPTGSIPACANGLEMWICSPASSASNGRIS